MRRRRGPGLRARLTLLATALTAGVSGLLLWLGWVLSGDIVALVPTPVPGSTVRVNGVDVSADQLTHALQDHARDLLLRAGSVAFFCVVLAAAILAWALTGRLLRPLQDVTAAARRLSAESLSERIALRGPRDEVAELADTFDAMLDRLQATFEAQRRFVANASHELRTPLSVIRTELDVTLADPGADVAELRRMCAVLGKATARAAQLVDALLMLARTDGTGLARREPVDLAAVVTSAWAAVRGEARERDVRAVFHTEPALAIGDPALLERVAGNLVENAVRHNVEGGWVEVCTDIVTDDPATGTAASADAGTGPWARLRVSSSGQVVPPERVAALFEPFQRGGVERTARSGTGLGLSIVEAVVSAHGGQITATPVAGGGLAVTVRLPASC